MCKFSRQIKTKILKILILIQVLVCWSAAFALSPDTPNGGKFPQYSPDGLKIGFLSASPHTPRSLYIMNADGKNFQKFPIRDLSDFQWSKDSKKVRYLAYRNGKPFWLEYNLGDTQEGQRISYLPENTENPVWSPDDKWVAYTLSTIGARDLWVIRTDGTQSSQLTKGLMVLNPQWIENGKKLIYQLGEIMPNVIMSMDISTKQTQMVYHGFCGELRLSNDKKKIAFTIAQGAGQRNLIIMNTDSTQKKEFPLPGSDGGKVEWSPQDDKLLYVGKAGVHTNLWIIHTDGTQVNQITPKDVTGMTPHWSKDGQTILFSGKDSKSFGFDIFTIQPDGTGMKRMTQSYYSQWAPSLSPDGERVSFFSNQSKKTQIQVCSLDGKTLAQIPLDSLDYNSRILWSADGKQILLTASNRIEIFDISKPTKKKFLTFPKGLYSADINYANGRMVTSAEKDGNPHILAGSLTDSAITDLTDIRLKNNPSNLKSVADLFPRWAPKGNQIAFLTSGELWTINADGTYAKQVYSVKESNQAISSPKWSPQGNKLVCYLATNQGKQIIKEILLIPNDGTKPESLYKEPVITEFSLFDTDYTYPPAYTPDGKYIFFSSDKDGKPNIWRIPVSGKISEKLTDDGAIFPIFLPDEDVLIYTSLAGNKEKIKIMNLSGQKNPKFLVK